MLILAACWAVVLVVAGALGIAGDADGEMNALNVTVVGLAALFTLTWGPSSPGTAGSRGCSWPYPWAACCCCTGSLCRATQMKTDTGRRRR